MWIPQDLIMVIDDDTKYLQTLDYNWKTKAWPGEIRPADQMNR
jgi:hypothetical protein